MKGPSRSWLPRFVNRGGPGDTPLDFFYRADDPLSHVMAQILLLLQGQGLTGLTCHVVEKLPLSHYPEPERYEAARIMDAVRLARLYGLRLTEKSRVPDRLGVQMIACHLANQGDARSFLQQAVLLGNQLWANDIAGIREKCALAKMEPDRFRQAEKKLFDAGGYESATLLRDGQFYCGPTALPVALKGRALKPDGRILLQNLYPHFNGFRPGEGPVHLYLALDCPFSYLAAEKLVAAGPDKLGAIQVHPILLIDAMPERLPDTKARALLAHASREAAQMGLPFLPKGLSSLERDVLIPSYADIFSCDDQYERLCSFLSASRNLWGWSSGPQDGRLSADTEKRLDANLQQLRRSGLWGTPAFVSSSGAYWGQDRLFFLSRI